MTMLEHLHNRLREAWDKKEWDRASRLADQILDLRAKGV